MVDSAKLADLQRVIGEQRTQLASESANLDQLEARARQLREHSGFSNAGVYDPPSVGGTHVIYVLHDITKPEQYGGLPANPQIPVTYTAWKRVAKPIALRGTVTIMEWVNPHSWIHIDVKGADGTLVSWMIEGGSPNSLLRLGFTKNALLPGMEIAVEGYQAKDGTNKGVGRSLTFADGRKLFLSESAPGGRGL